MGKKDDSAPPSDTAPPPAAPDHDHGPHDHEDKPHKHDDHATRAELEELRQHKHEPEAPPKPTPAVIDKPPADVAPPKDKKERKGAGLFF